MKKWSVALKNAVLLGLEFNNFDGKRGAFCPESTKMGCFFPGMDAHFGRDDGLVGVGVVRRLFLFNSEVIAGLYNTLRPRQNGRHFADDTFIRIFVNENVRISIKFSLKFVSKGPINNISALFQIMAWRRSGDKPFSEPMMVSLPTHICVTRPQWNNSGIFHELAMSPYLPLRQLLN